MGDANKLFAKAEEAREKEQDFNKALKLTVDALLAFIKEGNIRRASEIISSRVHSYNNLYDRSGNHVYLILAEGEVKTAIEIAESLNDKSALVMPYRDLGKVQMRLEKYQEAATNFKKSVEAFEADPPEEHNRPGVLADLKIHLAIAEYQTGDKNAYQKLESAIQQLKQSDEPKYNKDVWLSSAHIRAAYMLMSDDPELATKHLQQAEKIISSNNELTLMNEKLEKAKEELKI